MILSLIPLSFHFRSAIIMAILMHWKRCTVLLKQAKAFSALAKQRLLKN